MFVLRQPYAHSRSVLSLQGLVLSGPSSRAWKTRREETTGVTEFRERYVLRLDLIYLGSANPTATINPRYSRSSESAGRSKSAHRPPRFEILRGPEAEQNRTLQNGSPF